MSICCYCVRMLYMWMEVRGPLAGVIVGLPSPGVVSHWPERTQGAGMVSRVLMTVNVVEGLPETAAVRQVYFIVSGIGYRKDFLLLFLCFLGVKGGLHIVQHLIIMWAGSQSEPVCWVSQSCRSIVLSSSFSEVLFCVQQFYEGNQGESG